MQPFEEGKLLSRRGSHKFRGPGWTPAPGMFPGQRKAGVAGVAGVAEEVAPCGTWFILRAMEVFQGFPNTPYAAPAAGDSRRKTHIQNGLTCEPAMSPSDHRGSTASNEVTPARIPTWSLGPRASEAQKAL